MRRLPYSYVKTSRAQLWGRECSYCIVLGPASASHPSNGAVVNDPLDSYYTSAAKNFIEDMDRFRGPATIARGT